MKCMLLACCLIAGVLLVAEGSHHGAWKKKKYCSKLSRGCKYGKLMTKYCAWRNGTYETVEKPVACLMFEIKCTENKDEAPLHKGECGNCTQANVCRKPWGRFNGKFGDKDKKWGKRICRSDGNEYGSMCEFAVARCEAYNDNKTRVFPEPCPSKHCKKLEETCQNGTSRHNFTYCAWNNDNAEYETVTNGMACFMHTMKCGKEGEKLPLHKGECGNCTRANICKKQGKYEESKNGEDLEEVSTTDNDNDDGNDDDDEDDDEDDDDSTPKVKGNGRKMRGGRGRGKSNKKQFGRGKFRHTHKGGENRKGVRGHPKRHGWRKICDQDGNEYDSMCDFAIARCEKYAEDEEELMKGKCERSG